MIYAIDEDGKNKVDVVKLVIDAVYPIGSIYTSLNDTNPNILFGGTWEQINGKFLFAYDEDHPIGTTGGEETHTLSGDEIPAHVHTYVDNHPNVVTVQSPMVGALESGTYMDVYANPITEMTSATGGGLAHNNMPPYLAVNAWKRTA